MGKRRRRRTAATTPGPSSTTPPPPADPAPSSTTPRLLTREDLAIAFRVSPLRITKWQGAGLPVKIRGTRGRASLYDLADVIAWRLQSEITRLGLNNGAAVNLETERARLARAQSERAELDLEVKRGQVLDAGDVERVWLSLTSAMKEKLLALPRASAARCAQEALVGGAAAVEAMLRGDIHEALRELAAWTSTSAAQARA
jgi:phage terminase Nu1 subunit (DNA packaging protein)